MNFEMFFICIIIISLSNQFSIQMLNIKVFTCIFYVLHRLLSKILCNFMRLSFRVELIDMLSVAKCISTSDCFRRFCAKCAKFIYSIFLWAPLHSSAEWALGKILQTNFSNADWHPWCIFLFQVSDKHGYNMWAAVTQDVSSAALANIKESNHGNHTQTRGYHISVWLTVFCSLLINIIYFL